MYLRSSNSLHSILASVLCKKRSNIVSNSILRGSARFEWNHVWFSQSQRPCSKLRNDVLDFVTQSACVAYSLSLCVSMVMPSHHFWMIKINDEKRWGPSSTPSTFWFSFLQTLKEYEIIMLIYNRKSCRLDLIFF